MIVDLSVPLEANPSEPVRPEVAYEDHDATAPLVAGIFGCEVDQLPDGKGWASETVTAITHAGTHVDAPYHYFPTCDGEPARTIDELPLDWFLRPGVRSTCAGWSAAPRSRLRPRARARRPRAAAARHRAAVDGRRGRVGRAALRRTRAPAWAATARCGCSTAGSR